MKKQETHTHTPRSEERLFTVRELALSHGGGYSLHDFRLAVRVWCAVRAGNRSH